jgi:hypothetical protein
MKKARFRAQTVMLDLYLVGFATNLGSENAVVVDVGGRPYHLHHDASDGIGSAPRFREPKFVERRRLACREPQKRFGQAVLLGADDRALGIVQYVGQDIAGPADTAERAQGFGIAGEDALSARGCPAVFVLGRLCALEWNVLVVCLLPSHERLESHPLHHIPIVNDNGGDQPGHGIEVWLPPGPADVVKDCLGLGVGTAGTGIFGGVDFSDLRIPLLRMTRIEVLVKFLAIDALLGHCLGDRAERLVLGVLEALPDPSWLEARSEVAIKAIRRGCTICELGGALRPG